MAYTVATSFNRFLENINITGDHRETCNARRDRIVSLLGNHFIILEAFASGSIPKQTAVRGYADLDVIVALNYGKHIDGKLPSQVLQSVRDALGEYRTGVRKNGQAVTLYYETWPNVDIVPVSRVANNGVIVGYEIPDMNKEEWIPSNPKNHSERISERVSSYGPAFRRIIKMIKWWNHQHSTYLRSYHIEVLALEVLDGYFSDYSWNVFQFFDKAYERIDSRYMWYEGAFVDDYLGYSDRQEVLKRLDTARTKARSAWHETYGERNNHERAINIWRQIFGDKFPAYGS
jgi:Second Messenger Oligonucleotide or Dinucleotide Synthetase domain